MINTRNFSVDARGITREIASRLAAEPFVDDFTCVAKFIDNNSAAIYALIAKFYLSQISQQRAARISDVQDAIATLVDRQFCLYARNLNYGQLREIKHAMFQAVASGFFTRQPHSTGVWTSCKLERLSNDNYSIACAVQRDVPLKRGVTRINVHTPDRFRPVQGRSL